MTQREIWLVQYPEGEGHEYQKERPALIVESNRQINKTSIVTVIPFTSKVTNRVKDDILILKDEYNKLFSNSLLKVHHVQSFDKSRLIKRIGMVNENIFDNVKKYLKLHFDI